MDRELCTERSRFAHSTVIVSSGNRALQLDDGIGDAPLLDVRGMEWPPFADDLSNPNINVDRYLCPIDL